jgi:hypothetical protein
MPACQSGHLKISAEPPAVKQQPYGKRLPGQPDRTREPLPIPSLGTIFEVTVNGKVHKVPGTKLQRWINKRREEWKGPRDSSSSNAPSSDR